jgi:hypothetical protein
MKKVIAGVGIQVANQINSITGASAKGGVGLGDGVSQARESNITNAKAQAGAMRSGDGINGIAELTAGGQKGAVAGCDILPAANDERRTAIEVGQESLK